MLKDIKGYEGLYAVNEEGQVWSYRSKKFLQPANNGQGYLQVILCVKGKQKHHRVHRLVLETFNPVEGMDKLQVNHLDENKQNNNLSNLSWVTAKENTNYSSYRWKGKKRGKIKPVAQYTLDGELIAIYKSQAEAARQTGTNCKSIHYCLKGATHTAGGFIWRYHNGE